MKFRTDRRSPMFSAVYSVPRGSITRTRFATSAAASGMSAVIAMSPSQASAAM